MLSPWILSSFCCQIKLTLQLSNIVFVFFFSKLHLLGGGMTYSEQLICLHETVGFCTENSFQQ